MTIYGVGLLAACCIVGQLLGEALGQLLGIEANVGGVGFAMILLMLSTNWLDVRKQLPAETSQGISFWSQMYIPVIIAMAATQNVSAAIKGGLLALLAGLIPTALAFAMIPLLAYFFTHQQPKQQEGGKAI